MLSELSSRGSDRSTHRERNVQELNENSGVGFFEDEHVSLLDPGVGGSPGRQLERGDGPSGSGHAPGPKPVPDAHDLAVAIDEDDIDREPHEEHVYRAGAINEHPLPRPKSVAAEQASRTAEGALGDLAALADNGTVRSTADARERFT